MSTNHTSDNNNRNGDSRSTMDSRSLGRETIIHMSHNDVSKSNCSGKNCCKIVCLVFGACLLSGFTSFLTTQSYLTWSKYCNDCETTETSEQQYHKASVSEKQVSHEPLTERRPGAQVSANQTLLKGNHSRLAWSHDGPDDYLNGVNHVTHNHGNHQHDCLEATQDGHYLISVQLTYFYTKDNPSHGLKSYFTVTRFRNDQWSVVAKSDYVVPPPEKRTQMRTTHTASLVRSDFLKKGDRLCVTVLKPSLIYASKLDNFFGMVAL